MNRFCKVLSFLLLASVIATACGAEETRTSVPASEPVMTESPSTSPATATSSPGPVVNPTSSANTPSESIPVTGDINPGRLSHILDFDVYNEAGEQIGEVDDMILDMDATKVTYVIVGTGGVLDVGEKHVAVPWSALQIQTELNAAANVPQNAVLLVADQELFVNAPDMNMNEDLPEIGHSVRDWDHEFQIYWSIDATQPGGTAPPQPTPGVTNGMPLHGIIPATSALGFDFKLQGQKDLDVSIDDIIIDVRTGQIMYVVIRTNFENAGEQFPAAFSAGTIRTFSFGGTTG